MVLKQLWSLRAWTREFWRLSCGVWHRMLAVHLFGCGLGFTWKCRGQSLGSSSCFFSYFWAVWEVLHVKVDLSFSADHCVIKRCHSLYLSQFVVLCIENIEKEWENVKTIFQRLNELLPRHIFLNSPSKMSVFHKGIPWREFVYSN